MSKRNRPESPCAEVKKTKIVSSGELTQINDLNDDCLRVVFMELKIKDLYVVKQTCRRFASLADETVQRKYRHGEFKYSEETCNDCDGTVSSGMLRSFGKFIEGLHVSEIYGATSGAKLWSGIEHCAQLKHLELKFCDLEQFMPTQTDTVEPQNLEKLSLTDCSGEREDYARIIIYYANVKKLTVSGDADIFCGPFIARNFPRLKAIKFCDTLGLGETYFDKFVELNPQLENVYFNGSSFYGCHSDRLVAIVKYLPNIEKLSIQCQTSSANYFGRVGDLARLAHLNKLEINCCNRAEISVTIGKLVDCNSLAMLGLTHGTATFALA